MSYVPEHRLATGMVIPVSKQTYFNIKQATRTVKLCAYDMLYHPPNYDQKSARSDRQEPKIIRKNIWEQELPKGIASTTYFQLGRPKWKPLDLPTKEYVKVQAKNENPHMRIYNILEWATLINEGKPICDQ